MRRNVGAPEVLQTMTLSRPLPQIRRLLSIASALALVAGGATAPAAASHGIGAYSSKGAWSFVSAPRLHPPQIQADARVVAAKVDRGLFLLSNFPNTTTSEPLFGEGGPLVLDSHLQVVWFYPVGAKVAATDLQQESLDGKPVLSWWQGTVSNTGITETGEDVVVDEHYHRVALIKAQAPWVVSQHDLAITGHDAWVTVYRQVPGQDLSAYGGSSHGTVYDAGVQEYDLETGQLLYTWDALSPGGSPNIRLSDSETRPSPEPGAAWDAYHINTAEPMAGGQLLVSMRNTWGVYLIDETTGKPVWKLGGDPNKPSTFRLAPAARFEFQHDARLAGDRLTMFDDACCALLKDHFAPPFGPSRGLVLHLDFATNTATMLRQLLHRPTLHTAFLGSMQRLPGGNSLVGWGSLPYFTEYSRKGMPVLDAAFPGGGKDLTYRTLFTSTWVGTPSYRPRAVLRRRGSLLNVYVSWNGATEVARWEVLAGTAPSNMRSVAVARRSGFETVIAIPNRGDTVFRIKALDEIGGSIGATGLLRLR
jgi:hypothetical protein